VVQHGSCSAAAAWLGVSQSSLSRSVAGLEREVGARILRRPGVPVVATEAGEAFLAAAPAVLAAVGSARSVARGPA
jgi:LysR family carnitine catabolism transcriptional activator